MKKVLIFRQNLFAKSETFIRSQAASLSKYEPVFLARRPVEQADPPLAAQSLALHGQGRVSDQVFGLTGRSSAFREVIRESNADLVHAHFGPDGMLAWHSALKTGRPLVVTLHGRDVTVKRRDLLKQTRPVSARYALLRQRFLNAADLVLCVSEHLRKKALDLGVSEERLKVHYIGVSTDRFPISNEVRQPYFLHVARLTEKKGTEALIRAFAAIAPDHPEATVEIIGDGPLRNRLNSLSMQLGVQDKIIFNGARDQRFIQEKLARATAFVLPSRTASNGDQEGLPISILEAMSTGTPVISTVHSGIPEAIPNESFGLLSDENDPERIAMDMRRILSDRDLAQSIGLNGATRVRKNFDLVKQSQTLEDHYDLLLTRT